MTFSAQFSTKVIYLSVSEILIRGIVYFTSIFSAGKRISFVELIVWTIAG